MANGYITVDFTGFDIAGTSVTIVGIYDNCIEAIGTNKPVVISGVINDGVAISPESVVMSIDTDSVVIKSIFGTITVTSADLVSIATTKTTRSTK